MIPDLRNRKGFTLSEVLVSVTIGVILTGIAMLSPNGARSGYAISGAERAMGALTARARAHAVERGAVVRLNVDAETDSVWVSLDDRVVAGQNLMRDFGVDVTARAGRFHVCFTARGFADPSCSSSSGTQIVQFSRAGRTRQASILPLGQVEYR